MMGSIIESIISKDCKLTISDGNFKTVKTNGTHNIFVSQNILDNILEFQKRILNRYDICVIFPIKLNLFDNCKGTNYTTM